jgi:O-antigen/teichoic acid export membrane protein
MLLMSGRSGLAAMNKAIALTANVTGNLVLIPAWGIQGAAVSWSVSMLIDAALAAIEVRRGVGIRTDFRMVAYALIVPVVAFGIPAMAFKVILGANEFALLLALVVGGAFFIAWCFLDRDRLHLHELIARFRRR